jgi:hypothetical protein
VLVVVILVDGVPVPVVHVVDMIVVRHSDVATPLAVGVLVSVVLSVHVRFTLVVVAVMSAVQVTVVCIVDVITVRDGDVPAAVTVGVVMSGMFDVSGRHLAPDSSEVVARARSVNRWPGTAYGRKGEPHDSSRS